jgi:hypothetical protein
MVTLIESMVLLVISIHSTILFYGSDESHDLGLTIGVIDHMVGTEVIEYVTQESGYCYTEESLA